MIDYKSYCAIFRGKPMPLAYVDLDLLQENIRAIVKRAGGKPIRVASKSVRCVDILRRIFAADAAFQGIMCYSPTEAGHLARHGFNDLLVAYPCWNEQQIIDVCEHIRTGKSIVLMIDSVEHVARLDAVAGRLGVTIPVCLDVDLSYDMPGLHFGVWRSQVDNVEKALKVFQAVEKAYNLRFEGIMGYEAQIAGVGDAMPGVKRALIRFLKGRSIPQLRERRQQIVEGLRKEGASLRIVNGGGTGSLETTSQEAVVTEVTAGSGFYSPGLFDYYRDFKHQPAAGFAIEIVRRPKDRLYTCFGGGYVASGSAGKEKLPHPYLPTGAKLLDLEGAGEVQTPVYYDGHESLSLGDPIFMRHSKAGELCEHFNTLSLISGGKIVGEVPTYRGEGCKF